MSSNSRDGSKNMMMMLAIGCVSCVFLMSVVGGAIYYLNPPKKEDSESPTDAPGPITPPAGGGDLDGLRQIKYGGVNMVVPASSNCGGRQKPYFKTPTGTDQALWNFDPVSGQDDVYYIRSENKQFKKGCNLYLTSPTGCKSNAEATMEKPLYTDRQSWKAIPSGDGYQLMSVACQNSRGFPYLTSKGSGGGKGNTPRMANRVGTTYMIESKE